MEQHTPPQNTGYFGDVTPETSLRICDEVMVNWLSTLTFRDQLPTVTTAWVSRRFGQSHEMHADTDVKQARKYPYITLMLPTITPALNRREVVNVQALGPGPATDTNRIYVHNNSKDEMYILPYPLPFDLAYQVDIFAKTQQDMQFLRTSLLTRFPFANLTYLEGEFGGYGNKLLPVELTNVQDTSDLETGEAERELRNTFTMTMAAWIFRVPFRTKTIETAAVVVIDASAPDQDNLQDNSEFMAWYNDPSHFIYSSTPPHKLLSVTEPPAFIPPNRTLAILNFDDGVLLT